MAAGRCFLPLKSHPTKHRFTKKLDPRIHSTTQLLVVFWGCFTLRKKSNTTQRNYKKTAMNNISSSQCFFCHLQWQNKLLLSLCPHHVAYLWCLFVARVPSASFPKKAANEVVSQLRFVVHEEEIDRCILSVAGDGKNRGFWRNCRQGTGMKKCCKNTSAKKNMARILPDLTKIFLGGTEKKQKKHRK